MSWLWWVLGALALLLLIGWLLGLFGGDDAAEVETDEAVVVEETEEPATETVVTEEPAATEDAADTEAGGEPVVTEEGEAIVTEDGEPVVTEEAAD